MYTKELNTSLIEYIFRVHRDLFDDDGFIIPSFKEYINRLENILIELNVYKYIVVVPDFKRESYYYDWKKDITLDDKKLVFGMLRLNGVKNKFEREDFNDK